MMHPDDVRGEKYKSNPAFMIQVWMADRNSFSVRSSSMDGRDGMASRGKMRLIAAPRRRQLHQKVSRIHSGSARENEIAILL